MGEISGFGGGYEECCQDMLEAGVMWLLENPKHDDLNVKGIEGVFGLLIPDSDDAKRLDEVITAAAKGEGTGAMSHAVMMRLLFIARNGWDQYCKEVRKSEQDQNEQ